MLKMFRDAALIVVITLTVAAVGLWIGSYWYACYFVGSIGSTHHQFIAVRGHLYWCRNLNWWRVEKWGIVLDPQPTSDPIVEWPGMFIDSHFRYLGFETASGKWVSSYTYVSENDQILGDLRISPGTQFSSTTPVNLAGMPLWALLLATILVLYPIWRSGKKPKIGCPSIAH